MVYQIQQVLGRDFQSLVLDIPTSSLRALETAGIRITRDHLRTEEVQDEKMISIAQKLAKQGLLSKATRSLESQPPAPANQETLNILRTLHPEPDEPVRSAIPPNTPK